MDFELGKHCQFEDITNVIVALGSRWFVKEPEVSIELIVWEIYANILDVIKV